MTETESLIGAAKRVALLRRGIVVVEEDGTHVAVTGAGFDRVHEIARRVLGEGVALEVLGPAPREIRPNRCRGHMEREAGRLQVRYALRGDEHVDDIVVAEDEHTVVVFGTVCTAVAGEHGDGCEVPCHVYLRSPLGDRTVVDGTTGEVVPYKNVWAELEAESASAD